VWKVPAEKQPGLKMQDQKSGLSWLFGHMQLAHKSHNSQPKTASREETRKEFKKVGWKHDESKHSVSEYIKSTRHFIQTI